MDVSQIAQIVAQVGYPIALSIYLIVVIDKRLAAAEKGIEKLVNRIDTLIDKLSA